jgi:PAS domain S-box-containing protein
MMTERSRQAWFRRREVILAGLLVVVAVAGGVAMWLGPGRPVVLGAAVSAAALAAGVAAGRFLRLRHRVPKSGEAPAVDVNGAPEEAEQQELLSHIIDSVEGGVMTISSSGTITSFNVVAERTLGHDAKAVVGQHFGLVFPNVRENRAIRNMIISALTAQQTFSSAEVGAATATGDTRALGITISLLRGEARRPRGIVLMFKNLAELKRIREQVQRTDQLASLGRLAAGMAHEIRNPLGSLHGLVELIREDLP